MSVEIVSSTRDPNHQIFEELKAYPWSTDSQFQGGLAAILGSTTSPDQIQNLTLRAQCFYLSRKKSIPIDFDAYKAYLSSKTDISPTTQPPVLDEQTPSSQNIPTSNDAPFISTSTLKAEEVTTKSIHQEPTEPPYPKSFAEIVALIQSGAPIPGQVDIPTTILPEQATKPVARKRLKPWEVELNVAEEAVQGAGAPLPSDDPSVVKVIEGTFGDQRDQVITQDLPDV